MKSLFLSLIFFSAFNILEIKAQASIFPGCDNLEVTNIEFNTNKDSVYVTIFNACLDCETHVYTGVIIHNESDTLAANKYSNNLPNPPNNDQLTYKIKIRRTFDLTDQIRIQLTGGGCDSLSISANLLVAKKNISDNHEITLYPNPSHQSIKFTLSKDLKILNVSIKSLKGESLKTVENSFSEILISDLNEGAYFLSIETENGTITKKFIVN